MARQKTEKFQEWLQSRKISSKTVCVLQSNGFYSKGAIMLLTDETIDNFEDLSFKEKNNLKRAVNGMYSDGESDTYERQSQQTKNRNKEWNNFPSTRRGGPRGGRASSVGTEFITESRNGHYSNYADDEDEVINYDEVRWKEFGMARRHVSWKKDFYPVELFSPEGFWAWNAAAKSQVFGNSNVSEIWCNFEENKAGWLLGPPVLLPSALKSFKLTFSLRVKPSDDDNDPILQILLVNDKYNQKIFKEYDPLKFEMVISFISITSKKIVGEPIVAEMMFENLHDSYDKKLPGRILSLKKPPIISCKINLSCGSF